MKELTELAQFLSALATVAVGWFAWVQLRREAKRNEVARLGAQSRASASAFLLRRRVRLWIGDSDDAFERWIRDSQNAGQLKAELDAAEAEIRRTLEDVGELDALAAEGVRNCFVLLSQGVECLLRYAESPRPSDGEIFNWVRLRSDARSHLDDAVMSLEGAAIDGRLLDSEQALRDRRELDKPFAKLARDLALESEVGQVAEKRASLARAEKLPPGAGQ